MSKNSTVLQTINMLKATIRDLEKLDHEADVIGFYTSPSDGDSTEEDTPVTQIEVEICHFGQIKLDIWF
tara:strand:- start:782 stop:988 length:207 start_codon:yes stop_codon:yes gene_type:complete